MWNTHTVFGQYLFSSIVFEAFSLPLALPPTLLFQVFVACSTHQIIVYITFRTGVLYVLSRSRSRSIAKATQLKFSHSISP